MDNSGKKVVITVALIIAGIAIFTASVASGPFSFFVLFGIGATIFGFIRSVKQSSAGQSTTRSAQPSPYRPATYTSQPPRYDARTGVMLSSQSTGLGQAQPLQPGASQPPRYDSRTGVMLSSGSPSQNTSASQRTTPLYGTMPLARSFGYPPNYNANPHLCDDDDHIQNTGENKSSLQEMDASYNPYQKSNSASSFGSRFTAQTSTLSAEEKRKKKASYKSLVDAGMMSQAEYDKLIHEL